MQFSFTRYSLDMVYDNIMKLSRVNEELINQYQVDYKNSLKNDTSFNTCLFLDNLDSIAYKLNKRNKIEGVLNTLHEICFQAKKTTDKVLAEELIKQAYKMILKHRASDDLLLTYTLHQVGFVIPESHVGNLWKAKIDSEHMKVLVFKNIVRAYGTINNDQTLLLLPLNIHIEHSEEVLEEFKLYIEHVMPILFENSEDYETTYKTIDEYIDNLTPESPTSRKKQQLKMMFLKCSLDYNLSMKIKNKSNPSKI